MLQQTPGKPPQNFTHDDANTILSIIGNQPLQNMQAALGVQALMQRFSLFVAAKLGPNVPPPADVKPVAKAKGK